MHLRNRKPHEELSFVLSGTRLTRHETAGSNQCPSLAYSSLAGLAFPSEATQSLMRVYGFRILLTPDGSSAFLNLELSRSEGSSWSKAQQVQRGA